MELVTLTESVIDLNLVNPLSICCQHCGDTAIFEKVVLSRIHVRDCFVCGSSDIKVNKPNDAKIEIVRVYDE